MGGQRTRRYLDLPSRPHWDKDGGQWFVSPEVPKKGPIPMYRWRPSVSTICEPLLGTSLYGTKADGTHGIVGVSYPKTKRRHLLYREALELVIIFKQRADLFTLAIYRRQVTREGGIPLDELFLEVAETFRLSPREWSDLAIRMPKRSAIRKTCLERAKVSSVSVLALAAE